MTLEQDLVKAKRLVDEYHQEIEARARSAINVSGGDVVVSATASIDILFDYCQVNRVKKMPLLLFTICLENEVVLFDVVDNSPILEVVDVYGSK